MSIEIYTIALDLHDAGYSDAAQQLVELADQLEKNGELPYSLENHVSEADREFLQSARSVAARTPDELPMRELASSFTSPAISGHESLQEWHGLYQNAGKNQRALLTSSIFNAIRLARVCQVEVVTVGTVRNLSREQLELGNGIGPRKAAFLHLLFGK